jgi:hypothetical protein
VTALQIVRLTIVSLLLNIAGHFLAPLFSGLLFLDMVGTAFAGLALGPWWAGAVGALTNLALYLLPTNNEALLNFTFTNALGGIVWGYLAATIAPFPHKSRQRAFASLMVLSLSGALVVSPLALLVLNRFELTLAPSLFPKTSHNEHVLRLLASVVDNQTGSLAKLVPFELVGSLPDKTLSVCLGAYILYYLVPRVWLRARSRRSTRYAAQAFFCASYIPSFCITAFYGYAEFRATRGSVHVKTIDLQIAMSALPLLLAGLSCLWRSSHEPAYQPARLEFVQIYQDVLTAVGSLVAIIAGVVLPMVASAVDPNTALNNGLGLLAALGIFGALPGLIGSYYLQPRLDALLARQGVI